MAVVRCASLTSRLSPLLLAALVGACGGSRLDARASPPTTAPAPCDEGHPAGLAALLAQPVELDIVIVNARCAEHRVSVAVDDRPLGEVSLACEPGVRAPPPTIHLPPLVVRAGEHRITVVDHAAGKTASAGVTVPALEVTDDGAGVFAGGHLAIVVDDNGVSIGSPSAFASKGL